MKVWDVTLYPQGNMKMTPTKCYIFLTRKLQNGCIGNKRVFWKSSKSLFQ